MDRINVRIAIDNDVNRIAELLYQVHDVHASIRPDLFKKGARKYNEDDVYELISSFDKVVFVAESENGILGYAICFKQFSNVKTLYIDDICVDEKYRHNHIGKTIFEYIKEYSLKNDYYNLVLRVWEGNNPAKKFYQSMGFETLYTGMEMKIK